MKDKICWWCSGSMKNFTPSQKYHSKCLKIMEKRMKEIKKALTENKMKLKLLKKQSVRIRLIEGESLDKLYREIKKGLESKK